MTEARSLVFEMITDITYFQENTLALREHSINYSSYVSCLTSHPQDEPSFSDIKLSAAFSLTKEGLSERMSNGMNAYGSTPELKKKKSYFKFSWPPGVVIIPATLLPSCGSESHLILKSVPKVFCDQGEMRTKSAASWLAWALCIWC